MVLDIRLAQTARDWSSVMAAQDRLSHDSNLAAVATSVESRWSSAGENVGVGYDATRLHPAFMNSPAPRDNVMSSPFNRVGVGVVPANGTLWVPVRVLPGPAIRATPGQAP